MARVESLIKFNGTIGDLFFYKSKSASYQARMKIRHVEQISISVLLGPEAILLHESYY
ncbi:hypothetical protein [Sphingobacterium faecium]|uniref:hypothetical protein n=1 Tax=Sphingobacterium faecium TaxID=34087 RepID=UPI0021B61438|nr:hypothetical protein [Sphingobacterium faecium]UXD70148.1 hypothetical protein MUK51_02410 [Sphingobacterium faecium]WGQ13684.1 hypothetical protein QG727_16830 [Sphingobacterium faecium]